ncbi:MAG: DinB family protein [Pirellulaceae bacterium]|nr:DinB family protein [Pirellulaceae bacterium]
MTSSTSEIGPTAVQAAVERIDKARRYTLDLINDVEDDDWFRQPVAGTSHIAWQVGHLAMAEYALCLMRVRDSQPGDRDIISRDFRRHFSKGTNPDPDPANNPTPVEIRQVLRRVHEQVLQEIPLSDEQQLAAPLAQPHQMFDTKMGALVFCADHEYLHAGQIGLLRRLLGKDPLR